MKVKAGVRQKLRRRCRQALVEQVCWQIKGETAELAVIPEDRGVVVLCRQPLAYLLSDRDG